MTQALGIGGAEMRRQKRESDSDGFRDLADLEGVTVMEDTRAGLLSVGLHRRGLVFLMTREEARELETALREAAQTLQRPGWGEMPQIKESLRAAQASCLGASP